MALLVSEGHTGTHFEKTRASIQKGAASAYIHASDAGEDGVAKMLQAAAGVPAGQRPVIVSAFAGHDLDRALGIDNAVHLCVTVPGMAARIVRETARYVAFQGKEPTGEPTGTA